jgi:hypothetical protein
VNEPVVAACALAAFAGTVIFIVGFDRLPLWWFHLMLGLAIVLVGVAARAGGPETAKAAGRNRTLLSAASAQALGAAPLPPAPAPFAAWVQA